jgi:uncharacterized protein YbbC (DUF1343 family)
LGWDLDTPFSFPGVYGHTGFTGTSLWIDPQSRTYVIILTNRVHPYGRGEVKRLRTQVANTVAAALRPRSAERRLTYGASESEDSPGNRQQSASRPPVTSGIDVLAAEHFAPLAGLRVGLITNHTGQDAAGRRTIDVLYHAPKVQLVALFSPEHGLSGTVDEQVSSTRDAITGLPVYSLYGNVMRPTDDMLAGLDALVFDIQDAGARFYTYITTMAYAMEAAARKGITFYVLDRPNPLNGIAVQGPMLDQDLRSFVGYFPLPVRHGMTVGELATMFNRENAIGVQLRIIKMSGYQRTAWYDDTGLPWIGPSPNLPTLTAAILYPGVALIEGANLSVGRGTDTPFEIFGAPWLAQRKLVAYLNARNIPGVRFISRDFIPRTSRYAQRLCHGVQIVLVDRYALDAPALGIEIASALYRLHPHAFELHKTLGLIGARWVLQAIKQGEPPSAIARRWQVALDAFRSRRAAYLLY